LFVVVPDRSVATAKEESMVEAIVTATRYALAHPGIGPMLALHLAFTLCARPLIEMLPAYAGGVLHEGVDAVSLLTSAVGAGAIVSGLWLASRRSHIGLSRVVLRGMLWMGLAMVAFAYAPSLWVAAALALVIGGGMTVRAAGIQTLIQLAAADHLRGRVMSFYGLVLNGGVALGAALMGALAEAMGLRGAIAAMAIVSLAIWAAVMLRRREIEASLERPA
jgi:predicted MFS family arabinose efflux permease